MGAYFKYGNRVFSISYMKILMHIAYMKLGFSVSFVKIWVHVSYMKIHFLYPIYAYRGVHFTY